MEYPINKGIGSSVEFRGLKSQYIFIFVGGMLVIFILVVILYMIGVNQIVCIMFGVIAGLVLTWKTFALNKKYGEHGLMKLGALRNHPNYLINRTRISKIIKYAKHIKSDNIGE